MDALVAALAVACNWLLALACIGWLAFAWLLLLALGFLLALGWLLAFHLRSWLSICKATHGLIFKMSEKPTLYGPWSLWMLSMHGFNAQVCCALGKIGHLWAVEGLSPKLWNKELQKVPWSPLSCTSFLQNKADFGMASWCLAIVDNTPKDLKHKVWTMASLMKWNVGSAFCLEPSARVWTCMGSAFCLEPTCMAVG